jgi:hypothetical protein
MPWLKLPDIRINRRDVDCQSQIKKHREWANEKDS